MSGLLLSLLLRAAKEASQDEKSWPRDFVLEKIVTSQREEETTFSSSSTCFGKATENL